MASVRAYTRADYDQVARLFRQLSQTHRGLYCLPAVGSRYPDRWFHKHLRKYGSKSLRVAEDRGRVVGLVGLIPHRGRGEIEPFVVAARCRRRGIGRLLIQAATQEARRRRWRSLTAGIAPRNDVALWSFHSLGFRTLVSMDLEMRLPGPVRFPSRPGPRIAGRRFQS
ncbi:MAG: GNAT family N-acetyltransferase [Candidatus Lutacidiplasmatales archaeon]